MAGKLPSPSQVKTAKPKAARKGGKKGGKKAAAASKSRGARKALYAAASGPAMTRVMNAAVPAVEMIGAGAFASALAAYREAQGSSIKIGPVDARIVAGLGMHVLGLTEFFGYAKGSRASSHLVNLGTGILGSFLIDTARAYGAGMAKTAPAEASAKGVVIGELDESGAITWPWSKEAKEKRLERKLARVEKKEDRTQRKLGLDPEADDRPAAKSAASARKVFVIPKGGGSVRLPPGKYAKVGALAGY